jgi:adenylate kinase
MLMNTKNDRASWITGGKQECSVPPPPAARPRRYILLGAPGLGKGTQAEFIHSRLGPCQLSTGDVFRAMKSICGSGQSPAITEALDHMRRGEPVPDETVLGLIRERAHCLRCTGGFLLDDFPRTVAQAGEIDKLLAEMDVTLDAVISYELPLEKVVQRISGRRACRACKAPFHVSTSPPKVVGVCDHCGGELFQREDDHPEAVQHRHETYLKNTAPLTDYYAARGLLVRIECGDTSEETFRRTLVALDGRKPQ